ncbi:hypothetical protein BKA83DRAFT_4298259 [Pisolithus microcarpus]|nr:hypothetical protein BKA83DRAFT_4298259 [Pisolithus microcarpus]
MPILLHASLIPPSRAGALGIKLTNVPVAQSYMIDTTTRGVMLEVANGKAKETIPPTSVNKMRVFRAPNFVGEDSRGKSTDQEGTVSDGNQPRRKVWRIFGQINRDK